MLDRVRDDLCDHNAAFFARVLAHEANLWLVTIMKAFVPFVAFLALVACNTGGGGTVLPSPVGDATTQRACRDAAPDLIPSPPLAVASIWSNEGRGSAADALELLRKGFERVSFNVTNADLEAAARLGASDPARWSGMPLTNQAGITTLEVAPFGDPRCAAFEREAAVGRSANDDPMRYWTDTRFSPASAQDRNWCIATLERADPQALKLTRTVTTSQAGSSHVSVRLETLTDPAGTARARRTQVWMNRPSFPIGVSSVSTGCDGRTIVAVPEFFGPTGIAVRPASPPTLINK